MFRIKNLKCLTVLITTLFIISALISPTIVHSGGLKFGIISVVKDKIEELKEKKEKKEKELVQVGITDSNGGVTFKSATGRDICVTAKNTDSEPVSQLGVVYYESDSHVIIASETNDTYFSGVYFGSFSDSSAKAQNTRQSSALIDIVLTIYKIVQFSEGAFTLIDDPPTWDKDCIIDLPFVRYIGTASLQTVDVILSITSLVAWFIPEPVVSKVIGISTLTAGAAIKIAGLLGVDLKTKFDWYMLDLSLASIILPFQISPIIWALPHEENGGGILTNVALNRATAASGVWYDDPITGEDDLPEKAVDGNMNTRWNNDGFNNPTTSWWQVNLEQSYEVEKIIIKWYGISATNFKVQYWDGDSWEIIVDFDTGTTAPTMYSGDAGINTFEFSPISTDKVRFYSDSLYTDFSGNNTITFWEFEVYVYVE